MRICYLGTSNAAVFGIAGRTDYASLGIGLYRSAFNRHSNLATINVGHLRVVFVGRDPGLPRYDYHRDLVE